MENVPETGKSRTGQALHLIDLKFCTNMPRSRFIEMQFKQRGRMSTLLEEREEKMKRMQWRMHAGVVRKPSQFTRFVVVCMTLRCAAREVIPGN